MSTLTTKLLQLEMWYHCRNRLCWSIKQNSGESTTWQKEALNLAKMLTRQSGQWVSVEGSWRLLGKCCFLNANTVSDLLIFLWDNEKLEEVQPPAPWGNDTWTEDHSEGWRMENQRHLENWWPRRAWVSAPTEPLWDIELPVGDMID